LAKEEPAGVAKVVAEMAKVAVATARVEAARARAAAATAQVAVATATEWQAMEMEAAGWAVAARPVARKVAAVAAASEVG
jgi:hypothetical protein